MKKIIFALLLGSISATTFAQGEFLFNFQNPTLVNPASVGQDSAIDVFSVYQRNHNQYNFIYNSEILGISAPAPKLHGGIGLVASCSWIQSFNGSNTNLTGIYSYHKKTKNSISYSFAIMPGLRITDYGFDSYKTEFQFNISLSSALQWKKLTFGANGYNLLRNDYPSDAFKLFAAYNQGQPGKLTDGELHFSPMFSAIYGDGDLYLVASGTLRYKFMQVGVDISTDNYLKTRPELFLHAGVYFGNFSLLYRYCPDWYRSTTNQISLSYRFGKK
ncbi:hypothetical protein DSECCO2_533660 [anaerobic digester metagenome]